MKMTPAQAYILGFLTFVVLWLIIYLGASYNSSLNRVYTTLVCPLPPDST